MAIDADTAQDELTTSGTANCAPDQSTLVEEVGGPQKPVGKRRDSSLRAAVVAGVVAVVAVGGVAGWLGWRAFQAHQMQNQRAAFLEAGGQAALNLTTIDFTNVDAGVALIVNAATGEFREDFQQRAPAFIDVVKQAQSKSVGTLNAAGVESVDGDRAQILVAMSVKTTTPADTEPQPRAWRMRVSLQETSDGPKVSDVEFIP